MRCTRECEDSLRQNFWRPGARQPPGGAGRPTVNLDQFSNVNLEKWDQPLGDSNFQRAC